MILHVTRSLSLWHPSHVRTSMRWMLAVWMMLSNVVLFLASPALSARVGVLDARCDFDPLIINSSTALTQESLATNAVEMLSESAGEESSEPCESSESPGSSLPELLDEEVKGHHADPSSPLRRNQVGSSLKWFNGTSSCLHARQFRMPSTGRVPAMNGCGAVLRI